MGKLVNIDNGGTLTDICVTDADRVYRTKTLTTPFDLSRCFFDGLVKISKQIYGHEDIVTLLSTTDHIRYSTTQGTNALVERKGPRVGLILTGSLSLAALEQADRRGELFRAIVGERCVKLELPDDDATLELASVRAVNALASSGANRLVVAHGGRDRLAAEGRLKKIFLHTFPQHLLGAIPILYSHEVVEDPDDERRTWTAMFNAFLHPAMERFLYNAEHKLRTRKAQSPLLIFRNDGHSARVAKTIALKTYSSGPRGGMEGTRALAAHYGVKHLVSLDIGGTTTDIGEVRDGSVREDTRGRVEGVPVSFPLCNMVSVGVGGSSIIRALRDGSIEVGPESVGGAPGPACFGLGGTDATITDAFLLTGLLDPASYFGGELKIDVERARDAIANKVGTMLGVSNEAAAGRMQQAWVQKVADSIKTFTQVTPDTMLAAFGGAGPFVICRVAAAAGIAKVLIPGLAAVFSAFGLGFSDIAQQFELTLDDAGDLDAKKALLRDRARRGMHAEGFALDVCQLDYTIQVTGPDRDETLLADAPPALRPGEQASLVLRVTKAIARPQLKGRFGGTRSEAVKASTRRVIIENKSVALPLYRAEDQVAGARSTGPAVLEEAFFTCLVDAGWQFEFNDNADVLLTRT